MNISYLSYEEAKNHDQFLIQNGHTMTTLINTAGQRISDWLIENVKEKNIIGIIGKGNNGHDVIATFNQINKHKSCYIYCIYEDVKKSSHYQQLIHKNKAIELKSLSKIPKKSVILDGIYGTGLNKKLTQNVKNLIITLNKKPNKIIAIDIPSGLNELTPTACIKADITLTMMFPKKVFFNKKKQAYCGKIYVMNFKLIKKDLNDYKFPSTTKHYFELI